MVFIKILANQPLHFYDIVVYLDRADCVTDPVVNFQLPHSTTMFY